MTNYDKNVNDFHRVVNYYYLYRERSNGRGKRKEKDITIPKRWFEAFSRIQNSSMDERTVKSIVYDIQVEENRNMVLIGMHQPIDLALMSRIDSRKEVVKDFKLDDSEGSIRLANASAVAITEINGALVFALARGSSVSVPRQRALIEFFNHMFSQKNNYVWKNKGITMEPDKELLEKCDGVTFYTGSFLEDNRSIQSQIEDGGGRIRSVLRKFAENANGEVEIKIKVSDSKNNPDVQKELKEQVQESIKGMYAKSSIEHAEIIVDNETKIINLLEHDMATDIFLPPSKRIGLTFTALLEMVGDELERVKSTIEDIFNNNSN
ncbi:Uncharacterised protein [Rothia aeria]|uniref:Uncharacterized protein n=1 Tax=Rothia aeria TaxID=172042 RepID=A0A7Z9A5D9_9MICC|nr:hypothetical protein [Rothia aeria]VEI24482.1 Uncharacterised protein [Rothia aeria]